MGQYIAGQLPPCQFRFRSGEGHFSLALEQAKEFLSVLRDEFA
jgi:hypothetical protein